MVVVVVVVILVVFAGVADVFIQSLHIFRRAWARSCWVSGSMGRWIGGLMG